MQIQPRQNLLSIWQAVARHCFPGGAWEWGEGGGQSSIADAERLLCLLYPATEAPAFRLDAPDTTQPDVEKSLRSVGDATEIPETLVRVLTEFMERHRAGDTPTFSGGNYFSALGEEDELSKEQRALGVVDAYSLSVTLCLATLGFLKVYQTKTERPGTLQLIESLREATNDRLTAAMVNLLRAFTVDVYTVDSPQGQALCRLLGQGRTPDRMVLQQFQERFRALRAVIRESVVLGVDVEEQLGNENRLFECGWAWSVVRGAPLVETSESIGEQPTGIARAVPYLYFTVVALDGIQDLFSDRTLVLGLLNQEQQKLAEALRLRWTITQQYWSGIARFDDDRWPLEDIPWRTTGQRMESEYFSLCVASILVHDLVRRRATEDDLNRTVGIMERLAERGRVTASITRKDSAVLLHNPGLALPLASDHPLGPPMRWTMTDFSAQLLKRTIQLCALSRNVAAHTRLLQLAERTMDHLWTRRITDGDGVGLWDNVHAIFPDSADRQNQPSWTITERVTECMVAAQQLYNQSPIRSAEPTALAHALLSEATHLLGTEQLEQPAPIAKSQEGAELKGIEADLRRARSLLDTQPGTSCALALNVLSRLDDLARARAAGSQGV
ncbi:SCO2524 family protein [Streptomyces sp. NPDC048242]|uniref:SCO2524 family protein n=1 Tax=Streptomyces sp. NPDC048242 TaxID=3155026 RepID=UPI003449597A